LSTYLYVDGFNLYYGVFGKERNWASATYKWLDLAAFAAHIWPSRAPIAKTRYFTALVKPPPYDPQMAVRQQSYLRALRSIGTEVHLGTFKFRRKSVRLVGHTAVLTTHSPAVVLAAEAQIGKYDEKGSDVNLATYLIREIAKGECDTAIVISNDSDLVEPIRVARADFGIDIYVINPQRRPVAELTQAASGSRDVALATLAACQLPPTLSDTAGTITKPAGW
jgi:uncharacterized LabA/DUF88 family protein